MSAPTPDSKRSDKPTPDDLAGIPICKEEMKAATRLDSSVGGGMTRHGEEHDSNEPPAPPGRPTADDLAGIPVSAEGEEDLTIRPRKTRLRQ
jgi:hypothetical protein